MVLKENFVQDLKFFFYMVQVGIEVLGVWRGWEGEVRYIQKKGICIEYVGEFEQVV